MNDSELELIYFSNFKYYTDDVDRIFLSFFLGRSLSFLTILWTRRS